MSTISLNKLLEAYPCDGVESDEKTELSSFLFEKGSFNKSQGKPSRLAGSDGK